MAFSFPERSRSVQIARVSVGTAKIRSKPTESGRTMGLLDHDASLDVVASRGGWLKVVTKRGTKGWVRRDLVTIAQGQVRKKASVASGKRPAHVGKVHQPTTKATSTRVRTLPKVSVKRDAAHSLATSQTPVTDDASGQLPDVVKTSSQAVQTSLQIVDPIAEKRTSIVEFAQDAANYDKLSSPVRSTLMSRANSHRGTPYRFGSSGGGTFDCSGFTSAMYRKVGIKLPRTAAEQFGVGNHVGKSVLTKGDLVFFRNTAGRRGISHVGIFAGNGNFIHASSRGHAVRIDTLSSGYYANHFAGGRRLIH